MVNHGYVFNDLIFIGGFYPLQKGEDRKRYVLNCEAACLVDVCQIWILGLFLRLIARLVGVLYGRVNIF